MTLTNLSSVPSGETSQAKLTGKFMGSGPASADFKLRPTRPGPDFDLAVEIEETDLKTMNELLRAHGNFDVTAGRFSMYTEISVRDRQMSGYVKPLFQDMTVYDARQDRDKNVLRKVYEGVVGGISRVLQNRPRDEVATRIELSGRLDNPTPASSRPSSAWSRTRSSRRSCPASRPACAAAEPLLIVSWPWRSSRSRAPAATGASRSIRRSRRSSPTSRRPGRSPGSGSTTRSPR